MCWSLWTAAPNIIHKRVHTGSMWCLTSLWSRLAVNKEALEVNTPSWENMLAGVPLCFWGHSVIPVSWVSAQIAAGTPWTLTGKSHWVISELHLFVHRFNWALWPPSCIPVSPVGLSALTLRHTRVGYTQQHRAQTHSWRQHTNMECAHASAEFSNQYSNAAHPQRG